MNTSHMKPESKSVAIYAFKILNDDVHKRL